MFRFFKALTRWLEAHHVAKLAEDAVALALSLDPNYKYADLLRVVLQLLSAIPSAPKDQGVLERAAAGALLRSGIKPDGK